MNKRTLAPYIVFSLLGVSCLFWGNLLPALPMPESDIKFSHDFHAGEQEIECDACHPSIESSALSEDKNLPTMDECGACHEVEEDEECGICHKNIDDPMALAHPERELIFNHQRHLEIKVDCMTCHEGIEKSTDSDQEFLPKMKVCSECHNGEQADNDCGLCHSSNMTLLTIHPADWRHQHGDRASTDPEWCADCHSEQSFCIQCHRGDNLTGDIHDLNYIYTHGLDAGSNSADCSRCHDNRAFCVDCHDRGNRMPLRHSELSWGTDHGRYARDDIENCASCHEADDPTCARGGCHNDFDGIRGTDSRIHGADAPQFDFTGPWHSDDGYYCYQCHVTTGTAGNGFCGYCHH